MIPYSESIGIEGFLRQRKPVKRWIESTCVELTEARTWMGPEWVGRGAKIMDNFVKMEEKSAFDKSSS